MVPLPTSYVFHCLALTLVPSKKKRNGNEKIMKCKEKGTRQMVIVRKLLLFWGEKMENNLMGKVFFDENFVLSLP